MSRVWILKYGNPSLLRYFVEMSVGHKYAHESESVFPGFDLRKWGWSQVFMDLNFTDISSDYYSRNWVKWENILHSNSAVILDLDNNFKLCHPCFRFSVCFSGRFPKWGVVCNGYVVKGKYQEETKLNLSDIITALSNTSTKLISSFQFSAILYTVWVAYFWVSLKV